MAGCAGAFKIVELITTGMSSSSTPMTKVVPSPARTSSIAIPASARSASGIRHAAVALLRLAQKPSITTLREQMGGESPNTIAPLFEKYRKSSGAAHPGGPRTT